MMLGLLTTIFILGVSIVFVIFALPVILGAAMAIGIGKLLVLGVEIMIVYMIIMYFLKKFK